MAHTPRSPSTEGVRTGTMRNAAYGCAQLSYTAQVRLSRYGAIYRAGSPIGQSLTDRTPDQAVLQLRSSLPGLTIKLTRTPSLYTRP